MTNKFLSNLVILSTFCSCDSNKGNVIAKNENKLDFSADPNKFDYFENHFDNLVRFLQDSINKKSDITPKQIKKCIKYILRYKKIDTFYEKSKTLQFKKEPFEKSICIIASHYKNILNKIDYQELPIKNIIDEVYEKKMQQLKSIGDRKNPKRKSSNIIDTLRNFIHNELQLLMSQKPDLAFLFATSIIFKLNLYDILLSDKEIQKKLKSDETFSTYFSREIPTMEDFEIKSQYDICLANFAKFFHKKYPEISFKNDIETYLFDTNAEVMQNVHECVIDFFKENYQCFYIKFSKYSLNLLVSYLKTLENMKLMGNNFKDIDKILVLYFLNFKSNESLNKNNFVFDTMGCTMFRYDKFESEEQEEFNTEMDYLIDFVKSYKEMEETLFKEVTGKNITNGPEIIIQDLIHQLELAKKI